MIKKEKMNGLTNIGGSHLKKINIHACQYEGELSLRVAHTALHCGV